MLLLLILFTITDGSRKHSDLEDREKIAVLYDSRFSGYWGIIASKKGFQQQGEELIAFLSQFHDVEAYPFDTMGGFVNGWNSLDTRYDRIYIIAHGWVGGLSCNRESIGVTGEEYSFSQLQYVNVREIHLYVCNGATMDINGNSTAKSFAQITGAKVKAIANGKLSFSWYACYPYPRKGGEWVWVYN